MDRTLLPVFAGYSGCLGNWVSGVAGGRWARGVQMAATLNRPLGYRTWSREEISFPPNRFFPVRRKADGGPVESLWTAG